MAHPGGRPPKYKNQAEMQKAIDSYFATDAFIETDNGKVYSPTIAGLAYHLDLTRQGLLEYSHKGEFSYTVKKAKQKVEIFLEQRLASNAVAGTIFNLKNNFEWKDKTEQEVSGNLQISTIKREIVDVEDTDD